MGRRGPPRTPTATLRLRNSRWANRNPCEPKPRDGIPQCPSWLDTEAKACWQETVKELRHMGVITMADRKALTAYCRAWSRWREAEEFIQTHGSVHVIKSDDGKPKYLQQVPQVAIANRLLLIMNRYQQEFGLTPAARSRIQVDRPTIPKDGLMGLLLAKSQQTG